MAHPFNHWFHWQRLAKMPFELPLVMISVMTGYVWFGNDLLLNREHLFLFAMIFGVAILTISFGPALYQGALGNYRDRGPSPPWPRRARPCAAPPRPRSRAADGTT